MNRYRLGINFILIYYDKSLGVLLLNLLFRKLLLRHHK